MDDFNFYSRLLDKKDEEGVPLFNTIRAGRVCDDCKKLDYEEMIMCDHVAQTAHWKSVASHKRVRLLYDGDEARGVRETKGIVASSFTPCFEKKLITSCFSLPRFVTEAPPLHIYLTADPTGGGPSDLALASGYLDSTTLVVSFFLLLLLLFYDGGGVSRVLGIQHVIGNASRKECSYHVLDVEIVDGICVWQSDRLVHEGGELLEKVDQSVGCVSFVCVEFEQHVLDRLFSLEDKEEEPDLCVCVFRLHQIVVRLCDELKFEKRVSKRIGKQGEALRQHEVDQMNSITALPYDIRVWMI